jgi:hypothetical protein
MCIRDSYITWIVNHQIILGHAIFFFFFFFFFLVEIAFENFLWVYMYIYMFFLLVAGVYMCIV